MVHTTSRRVNFNTTAGKQTAGTFVMIVGTLVTWAIYTQGELLL